MKRSAVCAWLAVVLLFGCLLVACGKQEAKPVRTIEGTMNTYFEMSDGTWQCNGYTYQYRLEIRGRMPNAVRDSYYVYLSNIEEISFQKAMMASGLSSNMNDYFSPETAVLVELGTA
ncbi:MAG: immunogenic protein [Ruminococcaceae bacterium]|nr:immunogenic protein [Oscillospiraceae bacterium]